MDKFPNLFTNALDEDTLESTVEPNIETRNFEILIHGVPLDLQTKVYWM